MKFTSPYAIKNFRESSLSPNCFSPLNPRGLSTPKVGLLGLVTPLNQSSIDQVNTSFNISKLTGKSGWGGGAFTSVAIDAMIKL